MRTCLAIAMDHGFFTERISPFHVVFMLEHSLSSFLLFSSLKSSFLLILTLLHDLLPFQSWTIYKYDTHDHSHTISDTVRHAHYIQSTTVPYKLCAPSSMTDINIFLFSSLTIQLKFTIKIRSELHLLFIVCLKS